MTLFEEDLSSEEDSISSQVPKLTEKFGDSEVEVSLEKLLVSIPASKRRRKFLSRRNR